MPREAAAFRFCSDGIQAGLEQQNRMGQSIRHGSFQPLAGPGDLAFRFEMRSLTRLDLPAAAMNESR